MPSTSPVPMAKVTSSTARKVAGSPAWRLGLANATARFSTAMSGADASAMVNAAHAVHGGKPSDGRPCLPTRIGGLAAAWGEDTAFGKPGDPGHLAGDFPQPLDTPLELERGVDATL